MTSPADPTDPPGSSHPPDPLVEVARFLAARPEGADPAHIARAVFRLPAETAPRAALEAVRALLALDARFVEQDGRWRVADSVGAADVLPEARSEYGQDRFRAIDGKSGAAAAEDFLAVVCAPRPARSVALARFVSGRVRAAAAAVDRTDLPAARLGDLIEPEPAVVVGFDARSLRAVRDIAPDVPRETVRGLAARLLHPVPGTLESLAEALDVGIPDAAGGPEAHGRLVGDVYRALIARIAEAGSAGPSKVRRAAGSEHTSQALLAADRLLPAEARHRLPSAPGIYVFRARNGRPLYVGKAKNLRRRLLSHFTRAAAERERALHEATARITHEVLGSEAEALVREFSLIARYAPAWNHQRRVSRGRGGAPFDLLLFLPTPAPSRVLAYALRDDGSVLERELDRSGRRRRARDEIAAFYFDRDARRGRRRAGHAHGGRVGAERIGLLLSWYRANRDSVAGMRPSALADRADFLRVLAQHLADSDLLYQPTERV